MRIVVAFLAAVTAAGAAPAAHAQSSASCPWMKKGASPEQRADELVAAMTLDQYVNELHQSDPPWLTHYGMAGPSAATPELCIPELALRDAGSGVAGEQNGRPTFPAGVAQ